MLHDRPPILSKILQTLQGSDRHRNQHKQTVGITGQLFDVKRSRTLAECPVLLMDIYIATKPIQGS